VWSLLCEPVEYKTRTSTKKAVSTESQPHKRI